MTTELASPPETLALGMTLGERQKRLLVLTLVLSLFVSALSAQVVSTAMPRILADLGGFALLSWVFTVFMLASTAVTPLVGRLSDIYGRRVFMLAGISIFAVASAGAGLSTSMKMLIAFRGLQGLGGGMTTASIIVTIADLFPPIERGKYIALFMSSGAVAQISGPTVGGVLTDTFGWRSCFFLACPVALIAIALIMLNMPAGPPRTRARRIDFVGAFLLTSATTLLLLALSWGTRKFGWTSPEVLGLTGAAGAFALLLVLQERRHPEAIISPALFRNRDFVTGTVVFMFMGAATQGTISYLPTFIQTALGVSATASGLITTPQALATLMGSFVAGQLLSRKGRYKLQLVLGISLVLTGIILLSRLQPGDPEWHISAMMALMGLGSGTVTATMSVVVINTVPHRMVGAASSSRQFFQQVAVVTSVAIFGAVFTGTYASSFDAKLPASVRSAVPADVVERFSDPTISLDRRRFEGVEATVLKLDRGQALLDQAISTQRAAVTAASHRLFLGGAIAAAVALSGAWLLRELPLRRTFSDSPVESKAETRDSVAAG